VFIPIPLQKLEGVYLGREVIAVASSGGERGKSGLRRRGYQ